MLDLFRLDRQVMHTRCESTNQGFHDAMARRSRGHVMLVLCKVRGMLGELRTLMHRHPIEKPRIGFVLDVDLHVDEQASFEETCAMPESLLRESKSCP